MFRERAIKSVLIVDDDEGFCRVAAELLADHGYRVLGCAASAAEAVTQCEALEPDAVLLDIRLPDGNGVELAGTLQARPDPPSILLTSSDRKAVLPEQVRESGACGFVAKTELAGFLAQ
jgi:two-component system chemotaxis response regulator CheY